MLKPYAERDVRTTTPIMTISEVNGTNEEESLMKEYPNSNSQILSQLSTYLSHLSEERI